MSTVSCEKHFYKIAIFFFVTGELNIYNSWPAVLQGVIIRSVTLDYLSSRYRVIHLLNNQGQTHYISFEWRGLELEILQGN